jgi:hypothetical protein
MTREEAIRCLSVHSSTNGSGLCTDKQHYEAKQMAIQALEQEPKTGHWIRWYEQKEKDCVIENIPHCKCSECGKEYDSHSSQFIKYCNECGARMVKPQESEGV